MSEGGERDALAAEWAAHKEAAEQAYGMMRNDWVLGCDDFESRLVIYFDLQKALPTPKIATEDVYYRR